MEEKKFGEQLVQMASTVWRHRKGNEIESAILDTIEALWEKKPRPSIHHPNGKVLERLWKSKNSINSLKNTITEQVNAIRCIPKQTYMYHVYLPAGISYADFKSKERYFADASNAAVLIEKSGKVIMLKIMTEQLKNKYSYEWDWAPYAKMSLPIPFGYSAAGFIVRDLASAPNLITAGHPGAGKSNFLHVVATSLLLSRELFLIIIDLKKLEFSYLKNHALVISDMENARAVLRRINTELDNRLTILENADVVKIQDFRGHMPFIVLMIDELAEMQDKACQELLNRIVRLGRAAGVCVVTATQRPSSTIFQKFGDSKAMFSATMCFHVRDSINSRMLLDNDNAALIPNVPGRAIYQWERELEVQVMNLPIQKAKDLLNGVTRGCKFEQQYRKMLPPR